MAVVQLEPTTYESGPATLGTSGTAAAKELASMRPQSSTPVFPLSDDEYRALILKIIGFELSPFFSDWLVTDGLTSDDHKTIHDKCIAGALSEDETAYVFEQSLHVALDYRLLRAVLNSDKVITGWMENNAPRTGGPVDLATMPYQDYLQTGRWQDIRKHAIERASGRCQLCYADGPLDVHHRTYDRRGAELESDLIVLCRTCHARFHDRMP